MAEIIGITNGVISITAFAGQVAQSAIFLLNLLKDIKGAPNNVKKVITELVILTSLLENIKGSYVGRDENHDLQQALEFCKQEIKNLDFVKEYDVEKDSKKRVRVWKQLKLATKQAEIVKALVLQACSNISREFELKNSERLQAV